MREVILLQADHVRAVLHNHASVAVLLALFVLRLEKLALLVDIADHTVLKLRIFKLGAEEVVAQIALPLVIFDHLGIEEIHPELIGDSICKGLVALGVGAAQEGGKNLIIHVLHLVEGLREAVSDVGGEHS